MKRDSLLVVLMTIVLFSTSIFTVNANVLSACQTDLCIDYFKQYKKAAKRGHAQAMAMLGEFYYQGYGVNQDKVMALKYYELAAKKGITSAQYKAGLVYLTNQDYSNHKKAIHWLTKAAKADYKEANYLLGRIYLSNEFGLKDLDKADQFLTHAYKQKHKDLPKILAALASRYPEDFSTKFPLLDRAYSLQPLVANGETLTWPITANVEVIEVTGYAPESLFEAQLNSYRKPIKSLGSRLNGHSCADTAGCYQVNNMQELGDFLF
ncbi:tetratricopeptide repeat protein [Thalassotalea euphylliae]|uniref:Sel1 repeat family protein n=1 Tax=Thalassotalea euphylliae TaxID=1655234 RepID=A0A3E0UBD8_9GAMM|nr:tetratricopeptide repeat protein [Thalassotalea euphylliae]REL34246.1 sel1 repeat family protein [Thalassotalea euphylliae]